MRKFICWFRGVMSRRRGVMWDGHCWSGEAIHGADDNHVVCVDCGLAEWV